MMVTIARWLLILAAIVLSPLWLVAVLGGMWLDTRGPSSGDDAVRLTAIIGLCVAGIALIAQ